MSWCWYRAFRIVESPLPVISAPRSNALADASLLIPVLIVFGHESVSVPKSLLSSFIP